MRPTALPQSTCARECSWLSLRTHRTPWTCHDALARQPRVGRVLLKRALAAARCCLRGRPSVRCNAALLENQLPTATALTFELVREVQMGEEIVVVGNLAELGGWDVASGLRLAWTEGHVWTGQVQLTPDAKISFKFVKLGSNGEVEWEQIVDREVELATLRSQKVTLNSEWNQEANITYNVHEDLEAATNGNGSRGAGELSAGGNGAFDAAVTHASEADSNDAEQSTVKVNVAIGKEVPPGQILKMVGSGDALGHWDISAAPALTWKPDHMWQVSVHVPCSAFTEFKIVVAPEFGGGWADWQPGDNTILDPVGMGLQGGEVMEVGCTWEGESRAFVQPGLEPSEPSATPGGEDSAEGSADAAEGSAAEGSAGQAEGGADVPEVSVESLAVDGSDIISAPADPVSPVEGGVASDNGAEALAAEAAAAAVESTLNDDKAADVVADAVEPMPEFDELREGGAGVQGVAGGEEPAGIAEVPGVKPDMSGPEEPATPPTSAGAESSSTVDVDAHPAREAWALAAPRSPPRRRVKAGSGWGPQGGASAPVPSAAFSPQLTDCGDDADELDVKDKWAYLVVADVDDVPVDDTMWQRSREEDASVSTEPSTENTVATSDASTLTQSEPSASPPAGGRAVSTPAAAADPDVPVPGEDGLQQSGQHSEDEAEAVAQAGASATQPLPAGGDLSGMDAGALLAQINDGTQGSGIGDMLFTPEQIRALAESELMQQAASDPGAIVDAGTVRLKKGRLVVQEDGTTVIKRGGYAFDSATGTRVVRRPLSPENAEAAREQVDGEQSPSPQPDAVDAVQEEAAPLPEPSGKEPEPAGQPLGAIGKYAGMAAAGLGAMTLMGGVAIDATDVAILASLYGVAAAVTNARSVAVRDKGGAGPIFSVLVTAADIARKMRYGSLDPGVAAAAEGSQAQPANGSNDVAKGPIDVAKAATMPGDASSNGATDASRGAPASWNGNGQATAAGGSLNGSTPSTASYNGAAGPGLNGSGGEATIEPTTGPAGTDMGLAARFTEADCEEWVLERAATMKRQLGKGGLQALEDGVGQVMSSDITRILAGLDSTLSEDEKVKHLVELLLDSRPTAWEDPVAVLVEVRAARHLAHEHVLERSGPKGGSMDATGPRAPEVLLAALVVSAVDEMQGVKRR